MIFKLSLFIFLVSAALTLAPVIGTIGIVTAWIACISGFVAAIALIAER